MFNWPAAPHLTAHTRGKGDGKAIHALNGLVKENGKQVQ